MLQIGKFAAHVVVLALELPKPGRVLLYLCVLLQQLRVLIFLLLDLDLAPGVLVIQLQNFLFSLHVLGLVLLVQFVEGVGQLPLPHFLIAILEFANQLVHLLLCVHELQFVALVLSIQVHHFIFQLLVFPLQL